MNVYLDWGLGVGHWLSNVRLSLSELYLEKGVKEVHYIRASILTIALSFAICLQLVVQKSIEFSSIRLGKFEECSW